MSRTAVKICGLRMPADVEAANDADFLGFVFYPPSPRHLELAEANRLRAFTHLPRVAVLVDPDDAFLEALVASFAPDYLQLHGAETPERVQFVKARFGIPVIKALRVADAGDIHLAASFESYADMLMFDAKPPAPATGEPSLPGGNGVTFDWSLLRGKNGTPPWFLSGGLGEDNVEQAVMQTHAPMVDASSRLESSPGVKDAGRIRSFIHTVRAIRS